LKKRFLKKNKIGAFFNRIFFKKTKKNRDQKIKHKISLKKIVYALFQKKILIAKWELNFFGFIVFTIGLTCGLFFTLFNLGNIWAAPTQSSESLSVEADFDLGSFSETESTNNAGGEVELSGGSGPDNTLYFRDIIINNTNTSELNEYQVLIDDLDTAQMITDSKLQSDCDDLRFTNEAGVSLPYAIVGNTCNTADTEVWVKVDSIAASGDTTIKMYYGAVGASKGSSEADTFSYTTEKTVAYVLNTYVSSMQVITLEDDNSVTHNGVTRTLNDEMDTSSFSSIDDYGDVKAKRLFEMKNTTASDMIVPVSWAGTEFIFSNRNSSYDVNMAMVAPWDDATIQIYVDGSTCGGSRTVTDSGLRVTTCGNSGYDVVRVVSTNDVPFLLNKTDSSGNDPMPIHPADVGPWYTWDSNRLIVKTGPNGADYRYIRSGAGNEINPSNLGANGYNDLDPGGGGAYYSGDTVRIRSVDNAIGVQNYADSDGGDATTAMLRRDFSSKFGSPYSTDFIGVVSDQGTTCRSYNSSGELYQTRSLSSSNSYVFELGGSNFNIGDSNNRYLDGKWKVECDDPVMVVTQYSDDEQNMFGYPMMRQFTYPTPTVEAPGSENPSLPDSGTWTSASGSDNALDVVWNGGWSDNGNGNAFEANGDIPTNTAIDFEMRISTDGSTWTDWYNMTDEDVDANRYGVSAATLEAQFPQATYDTYRYIQFRATLSQSDHVSNPSLEDINIYYLKDIDAPSTNPTTVECWDSADKNTQYLSGNWYNDAEIYCEWSGATDEHSGVAGYYIHNNIDNGADPVTEGSQQAGASASFGGFTSHDTNYILIKSYDLVGNTTGSAVEGFEYNYDDTEPVNPTSVVPTPAGFTDVEDNFSFNWNNGSDNNGSGIQEYCYKTGDPDFVGDSGPGTEKCENVNTVNNIVAYQEGANTFYVRSKDNVGNQPAFYTKTQYYYSGSYPTPPQGLNVDPESNIENSFAFSWYPPVTYTGTINQYHYSVNQLPSSENSTATTSQETNNHEIGPGNYATQQGSNIFYIVAEDDIGINWGAYSQIEFEAETTAPGIPTSVTITDSSIRAEQKYLLTITWNEPLDTGSGIDHYIIERSTDEDCASSEDAVFIEYATTTSTGYLDSDLSNEITYCYRVKSSDNAGATSEVSSIVSALPEGRFTEPPELIGSPGVEVRIQAAEIEWLTDREGSSFVEFGETESVLDRIMGQDDFVTNHSVTLLDLDPSTTYYFRVKYTDQDSNTGYSSVSTFTTADAPSAPTNLSVTPTSSTTNSFTFSWGEPIDEGVTIQGYFYSINSTPTETNTSFTGQTSLGPGPYATQQGVNTFYVVAIDEQNNINYDNYASVDFEATTPAPAIPTGLIITDASNRETEDYSVALKWQKINSLSAAVSNNTETNENVYYMVHRSTDGEEFKEIAQLQTTGYLDVDLDNTTTYYYKVKARDSAGSTSADSEIVSEIPEGRFTSPPEIIAGPILIPDSFSATVSWDTEREADSHVEYGLTSDLGEEQGTIEETEDHVINLEGLSAKTQYYYRIRSRDQDGNVALSAISTFTTLEAPRVSQVSVSDIKLYDALVTWKTNKETTSTIEYGPTESYGSLIYDTSGSLTTSHTIKLTGLSDGTTYHFRPTGEDSNGNAPESGDYSFTSLTFPEVLSVSYENKSQGQTRVSWTTNVPTTSIVEYYNEDIAPKTQGNTALVNDHSVLLFDLNDATRYNFRVRGVDQFGYSAVSEEREFTTLEDTTPPEIFDVSSESNTIGAGEQAKVQIIISWKTDEATTSQIDYGVGLSGTEYTEQTEEDAELVMDHLVVISDLAPAKTYHFRTVSRDKAGNQTKSDSYTVLTSRKRESFLQLIISNLEESFSWLGNLGSVF